MVLVAAAVAEMEEKQIAEQDHLLRSKVKMKINQQRLERNMTGLLTKET